MSRVIRSNKSGMDYHFTDDWKYLLKRTVGISDPSSYISPVEVIPGEVRPEGDVWPPQEGKECDFDVAGEYYGFQPIFLGPPPPNSQDDS